MKITHKAGLSRRSGTAVAARMRRAGTFKDRREPRRGAHNKERDLLDAEELAVGQPFKASQLFQEANAGSPRAEYDSVGRINAGFCPQRGGCVGDCRSAGRCPRA